MRSFEQEGQNHSKHDTQDTSGKQTPASEVSVVQEIPSTERDAPAAPTATPSKQRENRRMKDVVAKSVVVIGIIIVLVILGWLGITAVRTLPNGVDAFAGAVRSFFTREKIAVGINPKTISTNKPHNVIITWRHIDKNTDGFYAFRYECADGVTILTEDTETVFCGSAFRFDHEANTLPLNITASTSVAEIEVPLIITFTPNDTREAIVTGSAPLTIVNTDIVPGEMTATSTDMEDDATDDTAETQTTPTSPGTPQTIIVNTTPVSNPNGTPDLAIRLLAIGIVDEDTGTFTPRVGEINLDDLSGNENVAVRFIVENLGDKTVASWAFEAELPTRPDRTFEAREGDTGSLLPGSQTEFTLGFDRAEDGTVEVRIEIDHDNKVTESNESNNVLVVALTLTED